MTPRQLGCRIREIRLSQKKTQQQIADACGVTQPTVQGWESGRGLHYDNLCKLAGAFGMKVPALLWEDEEPAAAAS